MRQYKQLNTEQKEIVDTILIATSNNNDNCFYIDGPGGSDKTHLYNLVLST